jgi:hypothetical protein
MEGAGLPGARRRAELARTSRDRATARADARRPLLP